MPRIRPIPRERAALVLRNLYDSLERQYGATPNLFKTMAHRPELLLTFSNVFKELWTGGVLDVRTKALAALRAAAVNNCIYALKLHRAAAQRAGLRDEQMAALERDDWDAAGLWDDRDRTVVRLAEKLTRSPDALGDDEVSHSRKWFGDAHLIELNILIGSENLLHRLALAFNVDPDG